MDTREFLLIVHIVGAFLIVGGAFTATSLGIYAGSSTSTHTMRLAADLQRKVEFALIVPGSLVVLVFGILLVADSDVIDFSEGWVSASFALWILVTAAGPAVLGRHAKRIKARAEVLIAQGVTESPELQSEYGTPLVKAVSMALDVALIVFVYLMVAKPGA